jgi:hypothetical protein
MQCNVLGMTQNTAYGATHHIRSIATVPRPKAATDRSLTFFHKSFADYLKDYERSGFSPDITCEIRQIRVQCLLRINTAATGR